MKSYSVFYERHVTCNVAPLSELCFICIDFGSGRWRSFRCLVAAINGRGIKHRMLIYGYVGARRFTSNFQATIRKKTI